MNFLFKWKIGVNYELENALLDLFSLTREEIKRRKVTDLLGGL